MSRIAHCSCGALRAEVSGEPALVAACHCIACQRRTGAPFGVTTYFFRDQVRTEGPDKAYNRGSDAGRNVEFHFCLDCGSTVFWYVEFDSSLIGIALGTFADPSMPRPTLSAWETTGHAWVTFDHELHHLPRQDLPANKVRA
ncbi:GFA family protein [Bradyrhizobium sp. SYSU BS000235]|uniref:GFA family protein n=1 Tax=Bradyrhizobium sp. SYSU BS000235 TaxID=3411332 RepID=UPI003C76FBCF